MENTTSTTNSNQENKFAGRKILLAEDDDSMRRLLEIILQKAGFQTFTAEDGLAAMQIALENEIDAVVADAIMPNLTGYDLCRILRDKKNIPIVILSGFEQKDSPEAESCLADVFLTKSAKIKEDLLSALENLLR
jgi:DNA-binding response OmpR family regulator